MEANRRSLIPGIILIIIGGLLLVHKLRIYCFEWGTVYPVIFMLLGILFYSLVWRKRDKGAVFPGTVLFLLGLFFFFRNSGVIYYYYFSEYWPIILIIFGLAFIVLFFFKPYDWGVLIPGGFLLFFGTLFFVNKFYYLSWRTRELIGKFWPVVLIVIGLGILFGNLRRRTE